MLTSRLWYITVEAPVNLTGLRRHVVGVFLRPRSAMSQIVSNSKARRDYEILESLEAGIVLRGTEVKSLRAGHGQISDAYARVENGEVWLYNAHIDEYSHGTSSNHEPKAPRKLLLHRAQIRHLAERANAKGIAIIPLALYWKGNKVKVQLAIARGKREFDKREDIKRRELERELRRSTMHTRAPRKGSAGLI